MERMLEEVETEVENPAVDVNGLKELILHSGFDPDLKEKVRLITSREGLKEVLLFQKNRWEKVE